MMNEPETVSINTDHFICPISLEMMTDPVICSDGITYERSAICQWFEKNNTSPKTNTILSNKTLIPNLALKAGITKYQAEQEERSAGAKRKLEEVEAAVEQVPTVRRMPARKAKKSRFQRESAKNEVDPADSNPNTQTTSTPSVDPAPEVEPVAVPAPTPVVQEDPMIQVFVKTLNGSTISVRVNKTGSVADIKSAISAQEGLKPEAMRIIYRGKQLESHYQLADCDVVNHTYLHLVLRLQGGGGGRGWN